MTLEAAVVYPVVLFLFLALLSLAVFGEVDIPFGNFPYQYLKVLYFVALVVAADRMSHDSPLGQPLGVAALVSGCNFLVYFLPPADRRRLLCWR